MHAHVDLETLMLRLLWSIIVFTLLWVPSAYAQKDFLAPEQAFRLTVMKEGGDLVRLSWKISEGYYLYRKQLKIEGEPVGRVQQIELPVGTLKTDEFFGETEVYHNSLDVLVKTHDAQALDVSWQGCADAGLCYPPQTRWVTLADIAAAPTAGAGALAVAAKRAAPGALG
jgi:thiol:disulfide interchange protein DsbD